MRKNLSYQSKNAVEVVKSHFPSVYFWLCAPPGIVFILSQYYIELLAATPRTNITISSTESEWGEASSRVNFLALSTLFVVGSVLLAGRFGFDLIRLFDRRFLTKIAIGAVVGIVVSAAVIVPAGTIVPRNRDLIDSQLLLTATEWAAAHQLGSRWWGPAFFNAILAIGNGAITLAAITFVSSVVSCLAKFTHLSDKDNWLYQVNRMKSYLYMGAAVLVVGVLFLISASGYPDFALQGVALAEHKQLVASVAMYLGVEYSLSIAAVAVPVTLILSAQADNIAWELANSTEDGTVKVVGPIAVMEARRREGLMLTPQDTLRTLIALMAPFITGGIASLTAFV